MPSKIPKQRRFMRIAAHSKKFAKKAGIKQKVAKHFYKADRMKKMESIAKKVRH